MRDNVVLITGANSGIGKATSIELARMGATVVMVCRNKQRGEEALAYVKEKSSSKKIDLMLCDLSSLTNIRSFCNSFKEKYQRLDILINNAGVILPQKALTEDGFEMQLGVNHFGHFLLTNLLLDLIIKSAPSRIINVSSGAHKAGKIDFSDLALNRGYNLIKAYSRSKLANILFTYELARRLEGTKVTVNCLHPGAVSTNMGVNRETGFGKGVHKMLERFFQTPIEGAATSVYLASSPEVEGVTGKYFYKMKETKSSKRSHDANLAKTLWNTSEALVGMRQNVD